MWTDGTLVSFDLESTSTDPETARIVTASVVIIDGRTGALTTHEWLADPGVEIPEEAAKVHGITTEKARIDGAPIREVVAGIAEVIDRVWGHTVPLIVYNASYDVTLLDRECRRHLGRPFYGPALPIVDPLVLDRALDPYRKTKHLGGRTLATVSRHYGVPISEADAHGSTADALCAARIAWKLGHHRVHGPKLADLVALQEFQQVAHRKWAAHTNEYFASQGQPGDISPDWPYRPYAAEQVVA